jgi:hypothetical protein
LNGVALKRAGPHPSKAAGRYQASPGSKEIVPRYFFHFVSPDHVVKDTHGIELTGLSAAHWHGLRLVHHMHVHFPDADDDWLIEISDETGRKPLVILPSTLPRLKVV